MGQINIQVQGSFSLRESKVFSAQKHGHAQAVADTIKWLSDVLLPRAIAQDHELHQKGYAPDEGYGVVRDAQSCANT